MPSNETKARYTIKTGRRKGKFQKELNTTPRSNKKMVS
jgi:hypothetical protein